MSKLCPLCGSPLWGGGKTVSDGEVAMQVCSDTTACLVTAGIHPSVKEAKERRRNRSCPLICDDGVGPLKRCSRSIDEKDCCSVHGLVAAPWKRWVYLGKLTHEHEARPRLYLTDEEKRLGERLEKGMQHGDEGAV